MTGDIAEDDAIPALKWSIIEESCTFIVLASVNASRYDRCADGENMSIQKIPLVPLSFSLTTMACADPIIGDWDATTFCQGEYCIDLPYESGGYMTSFSLRVDEDLSGSLTQRLGYTDDVESNSAAITVDAEGENQYKINIEEDAISLDCALDTRTLDCTYGTISWAFVKQ